LEQGVMVGVHTQKERREITVVWILSLFQQGVVEVELGTILLQVVVLVVEEVRIILLVTRLVHQVQVQRETLEVMDYTHIVQLPRYPQQGVVVEPVRLELIRLVPIRVEKEGQEQQTQYLVRLSHTQVVVVEQGILLAVMAVMAVVVLEQQDQPTMVRQGQQIQEEVVGEARPALVLKVAVLVAQVSSLFHTPQTVLLEYQQIQLEELLPHQEQTQSTHSHLQEHGRW
jgi:hypothetical protein